MAPGVPVGPFPSCVPGAVPDYSVALEMQLQSGSLYAVPWGTYSASLNIVATGVENSNMTDSQSILADISIPKLVRVISGSGNTINLGSYMLGGGDLTGDLSFCVYSNSVGSPYDVKADSANGTGAFLLSSGTDTLNYLVDFNDAGTFTAAAANLVENTYTAGSYAGESSGNCLADNASIRVTIPEVGNLESALPGSYTDTLTLTVQPM